MKATIGVDMNLPGARQYHQITIQSKVAEANPHQLISMLFEGLLNKLATAKGYVGRGDFEGKAEAIGSAVSILGALQDSLNMEMGGEIAANLDGLYHYISKRLFSASKDNDSHILDEVSRLIHTLKEGWDGIAVQVAAH